MVPRLKRGAKKSRPLFLSNTQLLQHAICTTQRSCSISAACMCRVKFNQMQPCTSHPLYIFVNSICAVNSIIHNVSTMLCPQLYLYLSLKQLCTFLTTNCGGKILIFYDCISNLLHAIKFKFFPFQRASIVSSYLVYSMEPSVHFLLNTFVLALFTENHKGKSKVIFLKSAWNLKENILDWLLGNSFILTQPCHCIHIKEKGYWVWVCCKWYCKTFKFKFNGNLLVKKNDAICSQA